MTEFKTLKDCKNLEEAREVAIKLVKANTINEWYGEQTILFIKHFFNISEEDLK